MSTYNIDTRAALSAAEAKLTALIKHAEDLSARKFIFGYISPGNLTDKQLVVALKEAEETSTAYNQLSKEAFELDEFIQNISKHLDAFKDSLPVTVSPATEAGLHANNLCLCAIDGVINDFHSKWYHMEEFLDDLAKKVAMADDHLEDLKREDFNRTPPDQDDMRQ